jgi:hypothetical protein
MKRCQWRGLNVHVPKTRDAVEVSDAAAEAIGVALFRRGTNVTCKCMADPEHCKPEDCDELYASDTDGAHFATIHGSEHRAKVLDNGRIVIYRPPTRTGDEAIDHTVVDIPNRLAELNAKNAKLWARAED